MKHQKKIHVIYIITKLELGGAQKVCLKLFNGLQEEGFTSYLISGQQGTLVNQVKNNKNIILLNSLKRELSFGAIIEEIKTFFNLIKRLRILKRQYPHLIVHTHSTKAGIIGRWAAFCAGIKKRVHTVHGYAFHPHQSKILWFLIYCIELVTSFITTHYVCVSSEDVKTGIRLFPHFSYKHSIIRAAVDQQFFIPAHKTSLHNDSVFIFGTIACFKPQKNIFDLLRAFKIVHSKHPRTRLEIIGDGILHPQIKDWIYQHNLTHVITLHGWQKQVAQFMLNWDAFALSSLWEGLPCAVVEARLLQLPVISYDTGGIHDVIFNGENGLLYKQKDWRSLADGMCSIVENKKLFNKFKNYTQDLRDFDNMHMVQEHIKLYQKLI